MNQLFLPCCGIGYLQELNQIIIHHRIVNTDGYNDGHMTQPKNSLVPG